MDEEVNGGTESQNDVGVPDATNALASAIYENSRPNWSCLPQLNPGGSTNCINSAVTVLNAGGFNTGGKYLLPGQFQRYLNPGN